MPKVSVVMPVFNREHYVREAIESILAQDFEDFEFIIVDDGSTDSTIEVVSGYSDPRIRLIEMPVNCGVSTARNVGLRAARSEYIAVMDSDDAALQQRLSKQIAYLEAHPEIDILACRAIKVMGSQKIPMNHVTNDAEIKARLLGMDGSAMIHPTTMMRAEFLTENRILYPSRTVDEDHGLWMAAMVAGGKFASLEDHLFLYRRHASNITEQDQKQFQQEKTPLRTELLGLFYPALSGDEVYAIAVLMNPFSQLSLRNASDGVRAAFKAIQYNDPVFGESRPYLNTLIGSTAKRVITALEKSRPPRQGTQ